MERRALRVAARAASILGMLTVATGCDDNGSGGGSAGNSGAGTGGTGAAGSSGHGGSGGGAAGFGGGAAGSSGAGTGGAGAAGSSGQGGTGGGGGPGAPACLEGAVSAACTCGAHTVKDGFCCNGTAQSTACSVLPAYYVAPTGNDANAGTSITAPFLTLEKARNAARASATIKTVYLLGGTYARSAPLTLGSQDSGQSWLAYPGQTPILDGGSQTEGAIVLDMANDVTIRWITFRNFVKTTIGALWSDGKNLVIDSNTIENTLSDGWVQAAIYVCCGKHEDMRITHNRIDGANYIGIHAGADAGSAGRITGTTIAYNAVHHTCRTVADCGGIYLWDKGYASTNVTVDHNVVGDFGTATTEGRGLYLDDNTSNITLRNNIVYGAGDWALHYHGGAHNLFENNIFDISNLQRKLAVYSDTKDNSPEVMVGNVFRCNVVYSSAAPPSALWDFWDAQQLNLVKPSVSDNVYFGTKGNLPNAPPIVDTNPTVANPGFVDPAARNYAFSGANPGASCGFQPIDTSTVGPLPNL